MAKQSWKCALCGGKITRLSMPMTEAEMAKMICLNCYFREGLMKQK